MALVRHALSLHGEKNAPAERHLRDTEFGHELTGPVPKGLIASVFVVDSGQYDDRIARREGRERLNDFESAGIRNHQVDDQNVEVLRLGRTDGFGQTANAGDVELGFHLPAEHQPHDLGVVVVVFEEKNAERTTEFPQGPDRGSAGRPSASRRYSRIGSVDHGPRSRRAHRWPEYGLRSPAGTLSHSQSCGQGSQNCRSTAGQAVRRFKSIALGRPCQWTWISH